MAVETRFTKAAGMAVILLLGGSRPGLANPNAACLRCHRMAPQLDSLRASSHGKVTACPDCHEPHGSGAQRLYAVASDGLRHAVLASLDAAPKVIRIHRPGAEVVQANCIRCHGAEGNHPIPDTLGLPRPKPQPKTSAHVDASRMCVGCHGETAHPPQNQKNQTLPLISVKA